MFVHERSLSFLLQKYILAPVLVWATDKTTYLTKCALIAKAKYFNHNFTSILTLFFLTKILANIAIIAA